MPSKQTVELWKRYTTTNPIADCDSCARTYTMAETDRLERLEGAGEWRCACGGVVNMRDGDELQAQEELWLAKHRSN
jgi:hypothetical protein